MKRGRNLLIGATAALAIGALPLNFDSIALGSFEPSSAFAKGGNGGGKGNGGGNGGGRSGEHGKSGDAHGKSGGVRAGPDSPGQRFKAIFSEETRGAKQKARSDSKVARSIRKSPRALDVAALPDMVAVPQEKPKEKNLHARLAGLNSLQRNYHAYLNSQSPRMASIRAFVMASAELDIARARFDAANARLSLAETDFESLLANTELAPYDDAIGVYDDPTLADLEARLSQLESTTVAPEDLDAWQAEVDALRSVLDSEEADALADAEQAADAAELAAKDAQVGTDDEALRQALLDAANENRVEQYGDDYVNDDVMDWAKDVLGVGDDFGKIDEVRETLEIDSR